MNWIHITEYIGLFGIWVNLVLIGLNTFMISYAYYNPNAPYSWVTALQIYFGHTVGILFSSLLVYGSQKKNTSCLIAWIVLLLLALKWEIIENQTGFQFLWIIPSIPLIDIVWRAKKQMDNEVRKQLEEIVI
jgi:hypothetical protein